MRKIEKIIVHCSAGSQSNKAADIVAYHLRPIAKGGRGWTHPGYHYIIEADGTVVKTLDEDKVSNGCYGHNQTAINVCYIGGVDIAKTGVPPFDNRTPAQRRALEVLLRELRRKYPGARIHGHRDFAPKACPSFDATKEYSHLALTILMLLAVAMTSCRTRTEIREVPVSIERYASVVDSLHRRIARHDSVISRDSVVMLIAGDTLIREAWRIRERIHSVCDTVVRLRCDTVMREIPVKVTVREQSGVTESRSRSPFYLSGFAIILAAAVAMAAWSLRKFFTRGG